MSGRCDRAPLCEQALATNTELRKRVDELERALGGLPPRVSTSEREREFMAKLSVTRTRLYASERARRELRTRPWVYLPWKGYVS